MAINKIPYGSTTPGDITDWQKQIAVSQANSLILADRLDYDFSGDTFKKGVVVQVGGSLYLSDSDTAITGTASDYVKLTPSGDLLIPSYVASISGVVTWNETYNYYEDVLGNAYIFDEYKAFLAGQISALNTKVSQKIRDYSYAGKNDPSISGYNSGTTYSTQQLVTYQGMQFYSFNTTGNVGKNPLFNPDYWKKAESFENLVDMFHDGKIISGGLHGITDRSSALYKQNFLRAKHKLDDTISVETHSVCLDGSVVTGNATLEAILTGYPYLDLIAPDVGGTRTLVDMSSRHIAPQSSGGSNDTLAQVLADRIQGHWHNLGTTSDDIIGTLSDLLNGGSRIGLNTGGNNLRATNILSDGTNGTPRTGSTTRPKEFTVGASYIIVMTAV